MGAIRIRYNDGGAERTLTVFDSDDTGVLTGAHAAAGAIHIPIGPGAHDCKIEWADDVALFPVPRKSQ